MPKSNLDAVLGRALRDEAFRKALTADPASIAGEYGLDSNDVAQLKNISQDAADQFFGQVAGGAMMWSTAKTCYQRG